MGSEAAKKLVFRFNGPTANAIRKFVWENMWDGRKLGVFEQRFDYFFTCGLLWNDQFYYPDPDIKEAIRRLPPHEYDGRQMRLIRAHNLTMRNEQLPKDQWSKWEEETFYLKPYLDEIEKEKMERSASTGITPAWWNRHSYHAKGLDH